MKMPEMCLVAACACSAFGDTVVFRATEDGDLAKTANWSASTWTADDKLAVSVNDATLPAAGLSVSADLPASAELAFGAMPNDDLVVNFGGHCLNTKVLRLGTMHDDAHLEKGVHAYGGFSGVEELQDVSMKGNIHFHDGVYSVGGKLQMNSWFPFVYVHAGAELDIENANGDHGVAMSYDTFYGRFIVDGGTFAIKGRAGSDPRWQRTFWHSRISSQFKILNGGEYRDDSKMPGDQFDGLDFLIENGRYIVTNSAYAMRNTIWSGSGCTYRVANSVFRTAQLYLGRYNIGDAYYGNELERFFNLGTADFENSAVTLAFPEGDWHATAGLVVPPETHGNLVRFHGAASAFSSQTFVLGGTTNRVSVEGGTFAVSRSLDFVEGDGSEIAFTGGAIELGSVTAKETAVRSRLTVSGDARLSVEGSVAVGGPEGRIDVSGGTFDAGYNIVSLACVSNAFTVTDAASTGCVRFAANDGRVVIGPGVHHVAPMGPGWDHRAPLAFTPGTSGNVLVISNGVFQCDSYVFSQVVQTAEGPKSDARPFQDCPDSRIEFRGASPKFVVTGAQASASAGRAWYALALGEMIDHEANSFTTNRYVLRDPVRLRYVLPSEGYAEAPCQVLEQILLLGGNAEFEFDLSSFRWPKRRLVIPLAYNAAAFRGWSGRSYIDVEGLNLVNAERLPRSIDGVSSRFELSADGKTLQLVVPGNSGTVLLLR